MAPRWLRWVRWLIFSPIMSTAPHPTAREHGSGSKSPNSTEESVHSLHLQPSISHHTHSDHDDNVNEVTIFEPGCLSILTKFWLYIKCNLLQRIRHAGSQGVPETQTLYDCLRLARILCGKRRNRGYFVPNSDLKHLITIERVLPLLQSILPQPDDSQVDAFAKTICESAPRLFATLVYLKREDQIVPLLEEEASDADLPFQFRDPDPQQSRSYILQGKGGKKILTLTNWDDQLSEDFQSHQWWMDAPEFMEGKHHHFDDNAMLPFTHRGDIKEGGFSTVRFVKIHPAHHNFSRIKHFDHEGCHVAIKKLSTANHEDVFRNETSFFATLADKRLQPHPHLMFLLATYSWLGKYFLVFPYAKQNLETYWGTVEQDLDADTMRWWLKQLTGLVSGLLEIHGSIVSATTGTANGKEGSGSSIKFKKGEDKFGRHGDIKPENILWFPPSNPSDDPRGTLILADFGLGRFHSKDTRSNVPWDRIRFSPTYEPPELKLHRPVSRAYDMWSFACILLEFATWMLKGQDGITKFSDKRSWPDSSCPELSNDEFFNITGETRSEAEIREGVIEWVKMLHQDERCPGFIHDLLEMTMSRLLVIDQTHRYDAFSLNQAFERFHELAKDPDYLVKPQPWATSSTTPGTSWDEQNGTPSTHRTANTSSPNTRARPGGSGVRYSGASSRSQTWPVPPCRRTLA